MPSKNNFKQKLFYLETSKDIKINRTRHRKRKVIWFNPRFCQLFNINIGQYLTHLVKFSIEKP